MKEDRQHRMLFEPTTFGRRRNTSYLIGDRDAGEAAVVDAGSRPEKVLARLQELNLNLKYVLATHTHEDHIGAVEDLVEATGAVFAAREAPPAVRRLRDMDKLRVGSILIEVIHTPGHTEDSVCFLVGRQKLLTGDTLFVGNAPMQNRNRAFWKSLDRIFKFDDDVEIWPGHDVGTTPSSTIARERHKNEVVVDWSKRWRIA